jgi:hypothetical protein
MLRATEYHEIKQHHMIGNASWRSKWGTQGEQQAINLPVVELMRMREA